MYSEDETDIRAAVEPLRLAVQTLASTEDELRVRLTSAYVYHLAGMTPDSMRVPEELREQLRQIRERFMGVAIEGYDSGAQAAMAELDGTEARDLARSIIDLFERFVAASAWSSREQA